MAKYIDAKLIRYRDMTNGLGLIWWADKDEIDKIPSADVQEVKHGKWIIEFPFFVCSRPQCKRYTFREWDYCPFCGAKMDEGE